jgi:hypothetical protein
VLELSPHERLVIRPLPGGDAVVAADEGSTAIILNNTAWAVVEMLSEPSEPQALADLFCRTFPDRDPAQIRRDIDAVLAELVTSGIVEPCGAASSTA